MREGGWDVRVFDRSEIPESPEIECGVGERRIGESKVTLSHEVSKLLVSRGLGPPILMWPFVSVRALHPRHYWS